MITMITKNPEPIFALQWFVLYTKSHYEKKVADGLMQKGLEAYCPTRKSKRKWSDRHKLVEEPLFRSYCFVKLAEKDRSEVFGVQGVVRYLFWLGKPAVVRETEIQNLRKILSNYDHENVAVQEFVVSDRVKVRSGGFGSLEGEIVEKRGSKLQVFMEALQMIVHVDLRSANMERTS